MVSSPLPVCDRQLTASFFDRHPLHGAGSLMTGQQWAVLADQMAPDARYFDSFYGWHAGREQIRTFLGRSMSGLTDWRFPIEWTEIGEGRVVVGIRNQLPGHRAERPIEFSSVSVIEYGPDGCIRLQMDMYDRVAAVASFTRSKLTGFGRFFRFH